MENKEELKMTKAETILQGTLGDCTCGDMYKNRNLVAPDCVVCNYQDDVLAAQKETAIKFAEWVALNYRHEHGNYFYSLNPIDINLYTTEQLYRIFNNQNQ